MLSLTATPLAKIFVKYRIRYSTINMTSMEPPEYAAYRTFQFEEFMLTHKFVWDNVSSRAISSNILLTRSRHSVSGVRFLSTGQPFNMVLLPQVLLPQYPFNMEMNSLYQPLNQSKISLFEVPPSKNTPSLPCHDDPPLQ